MKHLLVFLRPVAGGLLLAGTLKGLGAVMDLLIPTALGILIDDGIAAGDVGMIYKMIGLMLLCLVISLLSNGAAHYYSARYSQQMGEYARNRIFAKVGKLTPKMLEQFDRPTLITRITNDTENIQQAVNMCVRPLMRGIVFIVVGLILSLLVDVGLTIPIFIGMFFVTIASSMVYKITRPLFRKVQKGIDVLNRVLRENIDGIRFIKALDKSEYEINRFVQPVMQVRKSEEKAGKTQGVIQPGVQFLANAVMIMVVFVSESRIATGEISVGDVVTVTSYVSMILMASNMMPRVIMMLSRANISAERINQVLECDDIMQYGEECAATLNEGVPELEFRNVTFTYPGAPAPCLQNLSFRLQKGETLGITGDTGCGKTTLIALVLRFYDPQQGTILFRGKSLQSYDKDTLRGSVTAALQQFDMFAADLTENICLGLPLQEEPFAQAIATAQLSSLFETDEKGERVVTQRGTNLSGGQKQRVSVARTLYRDAAITMLDDVSGGLDYYTDQALRKAIAQNYAGKTILIASQRVSSVQQADKIIVLEKGKIVGMGDRATLEVSCTKYQEMCRVQRAGSEAVSC
ncbi:MAG: ABC transporter ATP-binding protein [Faecalibacterium sp.]